MKLHILGCSSVYPNRGQATTSYLIETSRGGLLVDCGHEAVSKLVECRAVRDLNAVIISHMHPDHFYGVFALSNHLLAEQLPRLPLFLPPRGSLMIQDMVEAMGFDWDQILNCFELIEYHPTRPLLINDLTIQFKQTRHPVNTYAMRFSQPSTSRQLVYTSDTGWFDELVEFCKGAHLLLVEATVYPSPPASESVECWHLTPDEAGRLIREAQVEKALVTHYHAKYSEAVLAAARSASSHQHVFLAQEHEEHLI